MKKILLIFSFLFCVVLYADIKYRVYIPTGHRDFLDRQSAINFYNNPANNATRYDSIQFTNPILFADSIRIADSTRTTQQNAVFQNIKTTAQSAVGVSYGSLTAAQVRALLAILLWKEGAFTRTGTVDTLSKWAK
jgi:hypothetical protein